LTLLGVVRTVMPSEATAAGSRCNPGTVAPL
jgi:hypothetical protein